VRISSFKAAFYRVIDRLGCRWLLPIRTVQLSEIPFDAGINLSRGALQLGARKFLSQLLTAFETAAINGDIAS